MTKKVDAGYWGVDKDGTCLVENDPVKFVSSRKKTEMRGRITGPAIGQMLQITIIGDPFPINVPNQQVTKEGKAKVPTATEGLSRKELRRKADSLGIEDWESMTTSELEDAVAAAEKPAKSTKKKTTTAKSSTNGSAKRKVGAVTKAPRGKTKNDDVDEDEDDEDEDIPAVSTKGTSKVARASKKTKKAAKPAPPVQEAPVAREVAENGNPFRKGSNLWTITEELIRGGRRRVMIDRLAKKIDLHPWSKKAKDIDTTFEMDKRILLTKNILAREHGFDFEVAGRGPENGSIKAIPPGTKKAKKK